MELDVSFPVCVWECGGAEAVHRRAQWTRTGIAAMVALGLELVAHTDSRSI